MKIAIIGSRGIPNRYGGFEQFAEIVSKIWVELGHDVICYNPHDHEFQHSEINGVKIKHIYCPEKTFGAAAHIVYDFLSFRDAVSKQCDIYLQLGYQSSALSYPLFNKSVRKRIVTNMDGMEWQRSKWSKFVKYLTKFSEYLAVKFSGGLVSDNHGIANYLRKVYGVNSAIIQYGCDDVGIISKDLIGNICPNEDRFYLLIARLEPENNVDEIINGFIDVNENIKLLIVGNVDTQYGKYLKAISCDNGNIIFTGSIYDKEKLDALRQHCILYFHGHSVGGTNPSLLEAMAAGARIIAHDNEFNRSVLGRESVYFKNSKDVSEIMQSSHQVSQGLDAFKVVNKEKINKNYRWEDIAKQYIDTFEKVISR
jgi:glycosyltransferase involved in cell wall biosynthesis